MPVITYPSSYSPNVNHSISSTGHNLHTLPKYSSTSSSLARSLNISNSVQPSKTYSVGTNSLSSTPRSSISGSHSPTSSSSSSNGSISSYNGTLANNFKNSIASTGVTLTSYSARRSSLINDDFIKTTTPNSLKIIPRELSGLTNLGNTCYMNSVLQAMYCTELFRKFVLRNSRGPILNALYKLFEEMSEDKSTVYPGSFRNQFIKYQPKFRGYEQQDAQEFLRYLINGVHDEVNQAQARFSSRPRNFKSPVNSSEAWNQYKYIDDSPLIDMVAGQLGSTLQCTICGSQSTTYDPFWDLSLPLPNGRSECNVQKCIQEFTAVELLAHDELIKCEKCNKQTRCTKKLSIIKLPTILILHLKRFSNEGYKLTSPKITPEETLIINNKPFGLYSIVCHHGYSSRSGHYTVYCNFKDKWYHINDDRITESTKFVSSSCEDAYILFYIDKEKDRNFVSRL